jgi:hypothetical protein
MYKLMRLWSFISIYFQRKITFSELLMYSDLCLNNCGRLVEMKVWLLLSIFWLSSLHTTAWAVPFLGDCISVFIVGDLDIRQEIREKR